MSLLPVVQQQPELFGRYAQEFGGSNASTVLLNLAHRMATLIMAYGFDIEPDFSSSEEEYDEEEADGSSQLAYELNKGMVPLADLCNAGTSENMFERLALFTLSLVLSNGLRVLRSSTSLYDSLPIGKKKETALTLIT